MTSALAVIEIVIEQLLFNNFTILIYTCCFNRAADRRLPWK